MPNKKRQTRRKKSKAWNTPKDLMECYVLNRECRDNPLYKLPDITPDFERAYEFFDNLFQNRMNENEYSVKEIAEKKGIPYQQILDWANQNDMLAFGLDMVKQGCLANAQHAGFEGGIDFENFLRYSAENMDDDHEEKERYLNEIEKIDRENLNKSQKEYVMSNEIEPKNESDKIALTDKEHERINEWRKKKPDVATRFKFAPDSTYNTETKETTCLLKIDFDKEVDDSQKYSIQNSSICAATGSSSAEYANRLFALVIGATGKLDSDSVNASFKALLAMKPADEYEGMLISRLIVLHQQYMDYMMKSSRAITVNIELHEKFINSATKLMRVYNETLEALNKHRRKGEQKVTVTHNHNNVNVNDGGKAIVGSEIKQ